MLEISTSALKTRKKVQIDGHGYTVRRLGAGEQLTLNQMLREAKKLEAGLKDSPDDALEAKAEELSQKMIDVFAGLFDDGGDGSKSKALIASLNEFEIQELFIQIFGESNAEVS